MSNTHTPSTPRQAEYARLREQLARIGWISEGYVQDRGPGAGGSQQFSFWLEEAVRMEDWGRDWGGGRR